MTVPPGRVRAAEPGRMVTGLPPIDGVKTIDEALGSRVMGELPMMAMTGAAVGAATIFGMDDGVGPWFGGSRMAVTALAGCPLSAVTVEATKI
jgi:hypothetical protein